MIIVMIRTIKISPFCVHPQPDRNQSGPLLRLTIPSSKFSLHFKYPFSGIVVLLLLPKGPARKRGKNLFEVPRFENKRKIDQRIEFSYWVACSFSTSLCSFGIKYQEEAIKWTIFLPGFVKIVGFEECV